MNNFDAGTSLCFCHPFFILLITGSTWTLLHPPSLSTEGKHITFDPLTPVFVHSTSTPSFAGAMNLVSGFVQVLLVCDRKIAKYCPMRAQ